MAYKVALKDIIVCKKDTFILKQKCKWKEK